MEEKNVTERTLTKDDGKKEMKSSNSTQKYIILLLLMIIAFMAIYMIQMKQNYELKEEEVSVISVLINVQEDNLYLKYGLFPSDVGLTRLREGWINNPCLDTAKAYSDRLKVVLDYLNEKYPSGIYEKEGLTQV